MDIFNKVSNEEILSFYLGIKHCPILISSPLRKDKNPSLGIYYSKKGNICYKDFATGESGSLINLLAHIYHLSIHEMLTKIYLDLVLQKTENFIPVSVNTSKLNMKLSSNVIDLKIKIRPWKPWDLEYWNSYGISLKYLILGKIYPISYIFFYKTNGIVSVVPAEKYAYAFYEQKDGKISYKIYQPKSTTFKWLNKHSSDIWDLWTILPPKGEELIITSSRKDALCLWENTGIPSCSLQAESYLPKPQVIDQLKQRFKNIYVLYDNDYTQEINRGHEYGKNLATTFNLIQLELPTYLQAKDSSDFFKKYGKKNLQITIRTLINNAQVKN